MFIFLPISSILTTTLSHYDSLSIPRTSLSTHLPHSHDTFPVFSFPTTTNSLSPLVPTLYLYIPTFHLHSLSAIHFILCSFIILSLKHVSLFPYLAYHVMRFVRRRKRKIINFFVSLFKTLLFSLYIAPFLSCLFYLFVSRKIPENPRKSPEKNWSRVILHMFDRQSFVPEFPCYPPSGRTEN
jgi:hypothetical protein